MSLINLKGWVIEVYGAAFDAVRTFILIVLGQVFLKGFKADDPKELPLALRILYYVVIAILEILAVAIAGLILIGSLALFDLIWPMIWPK